MRNIDLNKKKSLEQYTGNGYKMDRLHLVHKNWLKSAESRIDILDRSS